MADPNLPRFAMYLLPATEFFASLRAPEDHDRVIASSARAQAGVCPLLPLPRNALRTSFFQRGTRTAGRLYARLDGIEYGLATERVVLKRRVVKYCMSGGLLA